MNPFTKLDIFKHFLGIGTVSGLYVSQVAHIKEYIGLTIISYVYMYALFAYYSILYGFKSRLFSLIGPEVVRRLDYFKITIIISGVLLSCLPLIYDFYEIGTDKIRVTIQCVFNIFAILFPEFLLSLIFGIKS